MPQSGGSAFSGHNSNSRRIKARAIDFRQALLDSNLHGDIPVISTARQNAHDAVIGVTIETAYHRLAAVIFRAIRRSVAEARLCLKIEENRSQRTAGKVDAPGTLRRRHLTLLADGGELSVGDDERRILDDRTAVARDHTSAEIKRDIRRGLLFLTILALIPGF